HCGLPPDRRRLGPAHRLLEARGRHRRLGRAFRLDQIQLAHRRCAPAGGCVGDQSRRTRARRRHHHREGAHMSATQLEAEDVHAARPERKGLRKGLYLIPSAFTAANIGMGYFAVMGALHGFKLLEGGTDVELNRAASLFDSAAHAIGWAWVFDTLDGRIARLTKTTTEIGVQLDSLADVLTFGIAPAVLVYAWGFGSALADGSAAHKLGWFLSFMFLICGAFRLARFNVQAT